MAKDYYATLGVDRKADDKAIKQAYRRLARRYHPDVNPNDKAAEAKFKEVTEAYEILSDPEKRKLYDQFGDNWEHGARFTGAGGFDFGADEGLGSIFEHFFSNFGHATEARSRQVPASDIERETLVTLEEIDRGTKRSLTYTAMEVCKTCSGSGRVQTRSSKQCAQCGGSGKIRGILGLAGCPSCGGTGATAMDDCPTCKGAGRIAGSQTVEVSIPAGISEGKKLRVPGRGNAGSGNRRGDLYVVIREAPHPVFKRKGDDLEQEVAVPYTVAALGGEVKIQTLEGSGSIRIPGGSQSGQVLRLAGKGLAKLGGHGKGNMLVRLKVTVPKTLSPRERELLTQLAALQEVTA